MEQRFSNLLVVFFNILPIIGVAFYNWLPFEMFWLFWVETLIIAAFNCIRVFYSQGHAVSEQFQDAPLHFNGSRAFKYLLGRTLVFLFYSLFIIIFIGFLASPKKDSMHVVKTLAFANSFFNLALILCICSQAYYLVRYFFMNRAYFYSSPDSFPILFDGRQIVIHIALVIGAVGSTFLFKGNSNPQYASIWVIATLCIAKCVYELYAQHVSQKVPTEALAKQE